MQTLMHHALEACAARFPRKVALIMEEVPTTYWDLNREANQLAHGLLSSGIKKGDRVAFIGLNSREFMAVHYGAAKAGAVFTPLNFHYTEPELRAVLADAEPRAVIVARSHAAQTAKLVAELGGDALCLVCGDGPDGSVPYERFLSRFPDSNPNAPVLPSDDYSLMYTGGTSGRPKGVLSTHAARVSEAIEVALDYEVEHWDVGIQASPFFHEGTLNLGIQPKMMVGATLVALERFSPERYLEAIDRHHVTCLSGVPTIYNRLLSSPDIGRYHYRSVKKLTYGASTMPDRVQRLALETWPHVRCIQGYGSTECGQATVLRPEDHLTDKRHRTGGPMLMVDLRIVDENLHDLPAGETGELLVRSNQLFRCYHRQPELTADILRDGWYRTRDAAWMDDDRYVTIVGRVDDMIVSGGENVYPREVELILEQHPAVAEAVVFGVPDPDWVMAVTAAIVPRAGQTVDQAALIDFCRDRLASYKKPKHVMMLAEMPKTAIGKPDRKALRRAFEQTGREVLDTPVQ